MNARMALAAAVLFPVPALPQGIITTIAGTDWLFPGDLMHFLSNPERRRMKPGFFHFFAKDLHYDVESWSDPLPASTDVRGKSGDAVSESSPSPSDTSDRCAKQRTATATTGRSA